MRVLIAAGGTAGHINPALAIAGALKAADPAAEIHFAGRKEGMEYGLVTKAGYPFHHIEINGFQRKPTLKNVGRNVVALYHLALSGPRTAAILKEVRPDLVIGCGGYVSGPVVRAAAKKGIKTAIHEQNAFPGVTNKLLAKDVDVVAAGEPITLLGLPVRLMSYSSSLLPALLIALCAYYLEKFFNKIIPGIFKSLLVGLCTVTVTMVLGFTVLAPLGGYLGNYLAVVFGFLGDKIGFITVGLLAACLPWLVMCGMHLGLVPFMTQALTNPGYDAVFRPAFILHNMAEGGACIGVALRTKDAEKRAEALSIAFGCIVAGVTEPAIYGINLPRKKPMYGVMAGGAVGGVVAGLLGAKAYVMGYSTVLALPIFQNTIVAMSIAIVTAIVVAAVVTYVLGFEEKN